MKKIFEKRKEIIIYAICFACLFTGIFVALLTATKEIPYSQFVTFLAGVFIAASLIIFPKMDREQKDMLLVELGGQIIMLICSLSGLYYIYNVITENSYTVGNIILMTVFSTLIFFTAVYDILLSFKAIIKIINFIDAKLFGTLKDSGIEGFLKRITSAVIGLTSLFTAIAGFIAIILKFLRLDF